MVSSANSRGEASRISRINGTMGTISRAAVSIQSASTSRPMATPLARIICACRYKGRWSA